MLVLDISCQQLGDECKLEGFCVPFGHRGWGMYIFGKCILLGYGCLVWWMSDVVDVWCGGCPVWWMSGVVDVWCGGCPILHMVWWMSGVMDVWCGGCLVWWMSVWWMSYNPQRAILETCDLRLDTWDTDYISDNCEQQYQQLHSDPWIKSDRGQHSQFLRCFLVLVKNSPFHFSN